MLYNIKDKKKLKRNILFTSLNFRVSMYLSPPFMEGSQVLKFESPALIEEG